MTCRAATRILGPAILAACCAAGCSLRPAPRFHRPDADLASFQASATQVEYPDVASPGSPEDYAATPPITLDQPDPAAFWELSLHDAVQLALANSTVLRDLGGLILQSPQNVRTLQGPAIQETDPRIGVDAALSAFDATFAADIFAEKTDRPINNVLFLRNRAYHQDLTRFNFELSKRAAAGTQMTLRHGFNYDNNNTVGNPLPNAWDAFLTGEIRQPLLQGSGVEFNRIAGPDALPGFYTGVLIARVNTDISLADFEIGVRNLVADVETQYWELYFAYRDLDAKTAARDRALETWRRIQALYQAGRLGGEAEKEAQAREQYFRLDEEVQNALSGRQFQQSRTIAFAFRGINGVHANERELRLLMGVPICDGRLIRPTDEPLRARVAFDWSQILDEALARRVELRRQKWQLKKREMELAASRNFLYPQLDAFGRYRWYGLGQHLIDPERQPDRFDNAYQSLTSGDYQEWQVGLELSLPIGYRQAHAGVRNAQLQLARDQAVLKEQQRDITHGLASAVAEMERAYAVGQTNYNRRIAGEQQLAALEAIYEDADENQRTRLLDLILDAQRSVADAESRYYRSLCEYSLAVSQVQFQKGSLLEFDQVFLAEGPWAGKAYQDAAARNLRTAEPGRLMSYVMTPPPVVSRGLYPQRTAPADGADSLPPPGLQYGVPAEALPTPLPATGPPELGDPPPRLEWPPHGI